MILYRVYSIEIGIIWWCTVLVSILWLFFIPTFFQTTPDSCLIYESGETFWIFSSQKFSLSALFLMALLRTCAKHPMPISSPKTSNNCRYTLFGPVRSWLVKMFVVNLPSLMSVFSSLVKSSKLVGRNLRGGLLRFCFGSDCEDNDSFWWLLL